MSRSPSANDKAQSLHRDEMEHIQPAMSIPISPELFEQLYLQPHSKVKGELRNTFGNPTPIALAGFLLCTTPASMSLLGWQGAGGFAAAANVGAYFGIGGLLLVMGGIGEWILGNTFPSTVFFTFGGFWLAFGTTIIPGSGAYSTYSTTGTAADGLSEPSFYSTFAFFLVAMAILCTIYSVASIRTNIALFVIFVLLVPCFGCLAASFFAVGQGKADLALNCQHAGAGLLLAISFIGWYMLTSMLLLSVDFPIMLPLGDLSTVIHGRSETKRGTTKQV
ncbi:related to Y.lipolytica GPR1 protein and Fun34p [Fusarium torulosum]|uniref:Related to Y.lipolytica GPR1 protein and Fun34p n=1 Tax=Fusarium torulosum TaxID=33205 RepID=A0AAE8SJZ7_9HYPO|nr:related to Y.lipolytica GPR1 protein and Fun34p [Fusarium torulosum]